MYYFVLLSLVLSMFFSIETKFTEADLEANFSDEELSNIIRAYNNLVVFVDAVNNKEPEQAMSIISSSKFDLQQTISEMIKNRNFLYGLDIYPIENKGIQFIDKNIIKFTGLCKIQEKMAFGNFSLELFSNYFTFQKYDKDWVLIDTDFYRKLDLKIIYLCIFGIASIFIFWIWMIIDCVNRDFNRRGRWLALILFLNIIGALIYFFCIKLKQWKNKSTISE